MFGQNNVGVEEEEDREEECTGMLDFYVRRADIFDLFDEDRIYKTFRFDRDSIKYITGLISSKLERRNHRRSNLSPLCQCLIALQFFGTGTFQSVVGNVLRLSQPSVSRTVHQVANALCSIVGMFIGFPENLLQIKRDFFENSRLRGVIVAIDCTHVRIAKLSENEAFYVNRKGSHSINVQAVCDWNGIFVNVSAKKPGSCHDSTILYDSELGRNLLIGKYGEDFLLGDGGYGCTPFLMTPYLNPQTRQEIKFNNIHAKSRNVIERAFGMLKKRFHCLQTQLRLRPDRACRVIVSCFILHNIARIRRCAEFDDELDEDNDGEQDPVPEPENIGMSADRNVLRERGFIKRNRLAQELINDNTI